jgi:hypothetical protein
MIAPNGGVAIKLVGTLLTAHDAAALLQDADPKAKRRCAPVSAQRTVQAEARDQKQKVDKARAHDLANATQ